MALESTADLNGFFDINTHGTTATYTEQGQSAISVNGVFEKQFFEVFEDGVAGVESNKPVFICKTSDVSGATHGDTLVISGATYLAQTVEPDGTGVTTIILEEQ